jgi:hypothetical protein
LSKRQNKKIVILHQEKNKFYNEQKQVKKSSLPEIETPGIEVLPVPIQPGIKPGPVQVQPIKPIPIPVV